MSGKRRARLDGGGAGVGDGVCGTGAGNGEGHADGHGIEGVCWIGVT